MTMGQALTHQMIAREAAAMLVEENFVGAQINTDPDEEFGQAVNGYKKGDTVKIKVPPVPVVYDGATFAAGGAAQNLNELSVSLVVNKQKHTALTFTAKEKKLDIAEYKERFLRPCMNSLIAVVNADLLLDMKNGFPNVVQLDATPRKGFRSAASVLDRFLAPTDQRRMHVSSASNDALGEANAGLFLPNKELVEEFQKNRVGQFAMWDFFNQQSLPTHVVGAGAGYLVNGAVADGAALLPVNTGTGAIAKGSTFTIANVFSTHPLTGASTGQLRQFQVTADYAGGAGNIAFAPALNLTVAAGSGVGKVGNVNALPVTTAPVSIVANAAGKQSSIGFHRNSIAAAFPPLGVLASCEGYTATMKNISVRVMTFGDGKADVEHTRVDVLYGNVIVRPDHGVRVIDA
jgi:hypothetical protein